MPSRIRGRRRVLIGLATAWVLLEALCWCGLTAATGRRFSLRDTSSERRLLAAEQESGAAGAGNSGARVLHPYLGYVYDPGRDSPGRAAAHDGQAVGPLGFLCPDLGRPEDPPAGPRVAVFGGSVAFYFSRHGIEPVLRALSGPSSEARPQVFCFALGGYKQPQQLHALAELLAAGHRFDLVLELDGYNEVALAPVENRPKGVHPGYPRDWFALASSTFGTGVLSLVAERDRLRRARRSLARALEAGPLPFLPSANLIWKIANNLLRSSIYRTDERLLALQRDGGTFRAAGPSYDWEGQSTIHDLAGLWKRSSLQMHRLCAANGIPYLHVLQPNQYADIPEGPVPPSVVNPASPYASWARAGYPLLRAAGEELVALGVRFHDASLDFGPPTGELYSDDCCHLTPGAYLRLGERIALQLATPTGSAPVTRADREP